MSEPKPHLKQVDTLSGTLSDNDDDDDGPVYVPPDPFSLKQEGNRLFSTGDYVGAIELYQQGLKQALKKSVREPSSELSALQIVLRMNLAMTFMKEDDWVMAKEHMLVVLDSGHESVKAYFRMAEIYEGLQDYDRALAVIERGLERYPNKDDSSGLIELRNRIVIAVRNERDNQSNLKIDLKKALENDNRNIENEKCKPPIFDFKLYEDLFVDRLDDVTGPNVTGFERADQRISEMCEKLIQWRFKSETVFNCEVANDIDDYKNSLVWKTPWNAPRFEHDRTVLHLTLPLTILSLIENYIKKISPSPNNLIIRDDILDTTHTPSEIKKLPKLPQINDQLFNGVDNSDCGMSMRLRMVESLTSGDRGMVVHVLGARGDFEMETQWSALLERTPYLGRLKVVMIGFCDDNDPYKLRLPKGIETENGQYEYLSPPLVKNIGVRPYQKFIAQLYQGNYQSFIQSKLTQYQDMQLTKQNIIHQHNNQNLKFQLPEILSDNRHPLYPDIILIPQPNLSRYFNSWIPVLSLLALSNIPVIMTGHSVLDFPSHESLQFYGILKHLKIRVLLDLSWNPFMIPIVPDEQCPPMVIPLNKDQDILYEGLSAKNAVSVMFCGLNENSNEHNHYLISLINDTNGEVLKLRNELVQMGYDMDREYQLYKQMDLLDSSSDITRQQELLIEQTADRLKRQINSKIASHPAAESGAQPAAESPAQPAAEPPAQPAAESPAESAAK